MRGSRFARAAATRLYLQCTERHAVQAMLQRMEVRERERLADDERRHQLELEEQRKRKVSTHNRMSSSLVVAQRGCVLRAWSRALCC